MKTGIDARQTAAATRKMLSDGGIVVAAPLAAARLYPYDGS